MPRLYEELAAWWPLLSPPLEYPECEHILGDMRTLRLDRQFDVVLIHDAITYATEPSDVRSALDTAAVHCRAGGTVAVLPDFVRESFAPGTDHGGHDGADGRGLRYLEWTWDPDPSDNLYLVEYAFLLRTSDGSISVVHDRHVEGLFSQASMAGIVSGPGVMVGLLIAVAAGAAFGFRPAPPEVLQAERIELVKRQGLRQAQLTTDSLGLTMTLFDRRGNEAASFRFNQEPRLTVVDDARQEVVRLGAPRPQHLTH